MIVVCGSGATPPGGSPAPAPRVDVEQELRFVVKIRSYGQGDDRHVREVATALCQQLNRGFGGDRVEIWHEGRRVRFDPLALDGEHQGHEVVLVLETPPDHPAGRG